MDLRDGAKLSEVCALRLDLAIFVDPHWCTSNHFILVTVVVSLSSDYHWPTPFTCLVQAGKRRAQQRHEFMLSFLQQFQGEWEGKC